MGIKRRAMHNPKFKNSRPERWAMGERMRARNKSNSEVIEELAKVNEKRSETVQPINKVVTNVTDDAQPEVETKPETIVTEVAEKPKPKRKRATRKKATTTSETKPKTTRRRRTKKTA